MHNNCGLVHEHNKKKFMLSCGIILYVVYCQVCIPTFVAVTSCSVPVTTCDEVHLRIKSDYEFLYRRMISWASMTYFRTVVIRRHH
jgi:hypothetical protein